MVNYNPPWYDMFIAMVEAGWSDTRAAQRARIHPSQVKIAVKNDPDFASRYHQASDKRGPKFLQ